MHIYIYIMHTLRYKNPCIFFNEAHSQNEHADLDNFFGGLLSLYQSALYKIPLDGAFVFANIIL